MLSGSRWGLHVNSSSETVPGNYISARGNTAATAVVYGRSIQRGKRCISEQNRNLYKTKKDTRQDREKVTQMKNTEAASVSHINPKDEGRGRPENRVLCWVAMRITFRPYSKGYPMSMIKEVDGDDVDKTVVRVSYRRSGGEAARRDESSIYCGLGADGGTEELEEGPSSTTGATEVVAA
jgi:hypothetical protein